MNKKILLLIFFIVILILVGFLFGYKSSKKDIEEFPTLEDKTYIKNEIEKSNYCDVKEDCVLLGDKCPFDQSAINKNEADRIQALINSYESDCVFGPSACRIIDFECVDNKCEGVCG